MVNTAVSALLGVVIAGPALLDAANAAQLWASIGLVVFVVLSAVNMGVMGEAARQGRPNLFWALSILFLLATVAVVGVFVDDPTLLPQQKAGFAVDVIKNKQMILLFCLNVLWLVTNGGLFLLGKFS